MRKYFSVLGASLKQESKTLSNSITAAVSFAVIIFIFKQLWEFIYSKGGGSVINGYTLKMMIWYMIMAEVLMYSVNARKTTKSFGSDIKTGRIAYQLNKPYNYYIYQIFNQFGVIFWKLLFLIPTALFMGLILLGGINGFSAFYIVPILISLLLATLLASIIYGGIGLLSFWIEESTPFTWIIQKFEMLFGLFFPPEFFPGTVASIIHYSPVYAMMSGPCKLLAGFSWELFLEVSISQVCYIALFLIIGIVIYKSGTKKVNINGG